jgi:ABC-type lipoprotein export system ATPase subunit
MQRVAIARALALEPELLIADEPTGSLDSENGKRILDLLAELNRRRSLTILMATHAEEAAAYASRTLHIHDGHLVPGS